MVGEDPPETTRNIIVSLAREPLARERIVSQDILVPLVQALRVPAPEGLAEPGFAKHIVDSKPEDRTAVEECLCDVLTHGGVLAWKLIFHVGLEAIYLAEVPEVVSSSDLHRLPRSFAERFVENMVEMANDMTDETLAECLGIAGTEFVQVATLVVAFCFLKRRNLYKAKAYGLLPAVLDGLKGTGQLQTCAAAAAKHCLLATKCLQVVAEASPSELLASLEDPLPEAVATQFAARVNDPTDADVRVVCEDGELYAHKVILTTASPHFRTSLAFSERSSSQISLSDMPSRIVRAILFHLYTRRATGSAALGDGFDDLCQLPWAAHRLDLQELQRGCEIELLRCLEAEHCSPEMLSAMLNLTRDRSGALADFEEAVLQYAAANAPALLGSSCCSSNASAGVIEWMERKLRASDAWF
eukprot:TRINITY_DN46480_c0_g1_i1.p1 TRINITY_DN46480_c0_g1~~TRINITY_DN46480_c0_g1_i1.p1  ORF type:complete len:439 (+),score=53.11 TRINITY_DN46480_c0_g1_i1:75-1319(+)